MKSFKSWPNEAKEPLDNDSRGKLHELLTAAHINNMIHGKKAHAEHFRYEQGRTPEEAHNDIAKGVSKKDYDEADAHAHQAASHIHEHLKANHPEVLNHNHHIKVSWTSLKSDHEKLTGKKDEAHAGGADLMVSSHDKKTGDTHHAVGYSLKIADNKITTGQTGSKTTEHVLGMKPGSLQKHDDAHRKEVAEILKKHGHDSDNMSEAEKHAAFKVSRDHPKEAGQKLAKDIRTSSYKHAANKVKEIKAHLESKSDSEQKSRLNEFVAPSHTYPTYQVATSPSKKTTYVKHEKSELTEKQAKAGKLSYHQSEGNANGLIIKNSQGGTMHRFAILSKRPVGHSEVTVK